LLVVLVFAAAALWLATVIWARSMEVMPGTMGMDLVTFVVMWTLMMAAMMLPSAFTMITLYASMVQSRSKRLSRFIAGYLLTWSLTGVPAFALAWFAGEIAVDHQAWARASAAVIFAAAGLYQLTPLKERCLRHCRTPLGHLLHYGSYRGAFRDLRAGMHHGLFCLGCCWGLMLLMVAFGVMNLATMTILAGVIALEKQWTHGEKVARGVGILALLLAIGVLFVPDLAPGLLATAMDAM
jgi:predicted metal-binding membrane protein